jgi:DNA-binding transcriptional regulator YhcF (GntR family)
MKKKPGMQKAVGFIMHGIAADRFRDQLPSIKSLAKAADVSYVTMWKAIEELKAQGTISRSNRAVSPPVNATPPTSSDDEREAPHATVEGRDIEVFEPRWRKMLTRLKQDILTGGFHPGQPLPSCKELQGLYNVSYPTLKKVLESLVEQDIIKTHQRGYIVPALAKSESSARIVVIGCGWEDGTLWIDYQDKNYFRILESECIQSKISLDIVVYCRQSDQICFIDTVSRKPYTLSNENVLSFIVIVANLKISPEEVLQKLLLLKKPVAVLDVVGGWEASPRMLNNYYFRLFTVTTSMHPPQWVGRYMLNLGHSEIAFISPFHKALWSQQRLRGIKELYRDAGLVNNVHPFVLDRYAFQWDYLQEDFDNPEDIKALIAGYNKWQNYADSKFIRKFGHYNYTIFKYLSEWNCATGEIYHRMMPLFERALENKRISAWVMANDYTATLALDYLKKNNKRVPEDLSVISFDNTIDAMENQLTSYDFNLNGIVSIMLRYALRPSSVASPQGKVAVEAEGTIIERRSTARIGVGKGKA